MGDLKKMKPIIYHNLTQIKMNMRLMTTSGAMGTSVEDASMSGMSLATWANSMVENEASNGDTSCGEAYSDQPVHMLIFKKNMMTAQTFSLRQRAMHVFLSEIF